MIEIKSSRWLRQLGWALARLPTAERDEIIRETRSHIEERLAEGHPVESVLAGFGDADRYARQFMEEMEAYEALGSQRSGDLALFVLGQAHRNAFAAGALLLVTALGGVGLVALVIAILKIADPAHTGLWQGPDFTFLGVINQPVEAQEVLGFWLLPLAALLLVLALMAGRLLLAFTVRTLLRGIETPGVPASRANG